jgi:hypothetical protein
LRSKLDFVKDQNYYAIASTGKQKNAPHMLAMVLKNGQSTCGTWK